MSTSLLRALFAFVCLGCALPEATVAADADRFGVKQLNPTAVGGREWFATWDQQRKIPRYSFDPLDPVFKNEDGELSIDGGVATVQAGLTRLMITTPQDGGGKVAVKPWQNVEMTIYAKRGASSRGLSYQALDLSARSGERHNDKAPCDGTSYHSTARFDGKWGFKKEIWHTGGYTDLLPRPAPSLWKEVPLDQWLGLKFVCRNSDGGRHVKLQAYLDLAEQNEWRLIAELADQGGWEGKEVSCDRPRDYIITEARPAVYFRTDYTAVAAKKFSVREIEPLP